MEMAKFEDIRLKREYKTVGAMIGLYCRLKHSIHDGLCDGCSQLLTYAEKCLKKCPYHGDKPSCSKCTIHCYKPEMRIRIREVMRFSGPRMVWHHPIMAFRHFLK